MKPVTGKCVIAASLACVSLTSALCLTVGNRSALAEDAVYDDYNLSVCEQRLTTIGDIIPELVAGYNRVYESDWAASEIEYSSPVFIVEDDEYGMYLDFDGDNGYLVMTTDNKIYGVETRGDLQWLRYESEKYYSYTSGFLYIDDNGVYQKCKYESAGCEDEIACIGNTASAIGGAANSTQTTGGNGGFDPSTLNAYVAENYPEYTFDCKYVSMASDFTYSINLDTSYYKKYVNTVPLECDSNSVINAMYNVMNDWVKRGYITGVTYNYKIDIKDDLPADPFYSVYGTKTKNGCTPSGTVYVWDKNEENNLRNMPRLYTYLRGYSIGKGYTPENELAYTEVLGAMKFVANNVYNNNIKVYRSDNDIHVTLAIKAKQSCVLNVVSNDTNQGYGAAVVGLYRYKRVESVVDGVNRYEYKLFYVLADGNNTTSQIFDPDKSANQSLYFTYLELPRC